MRGKKAIMNSNTGAGSLHYSQREILEVLIDIRDALVELKKK